MSFFELLLGLFAIIFWITRVAIALLASLDMEFLVTPFNLTIEIALTFVALICIIFIFKKNIFAALLYLVSYCGYFGWGIYNIFETKESITQADYFNVLLSVLGILLALIIFIDIGFSQSSKKTSMKTKKTDWFFQNKDFDRQYDERADKNQYKF